VIVDWTKFVASTRDSFARSSADAYCAGARALIDWLGPERELAPGDLQAWCDGLVHQGRSANSIAQYIRGANLLVDWMRVQGHTIPELERVKMPRVWRRALVPAELAEQYRSRVALAEPYRTCALLAPEIALGVYEWAHWPAQRLAVDKELRAWTLLDEGGIKVATLGRWATTRLQEYITKIRPGLDGYSPSSEWLFPRARGNAPIEGSVVNKEVRRIVRELRYWRQRKEVPEPRKETA